MARYLALLFFLAAVTGCGQKGPLFLPGDPSEIVTVPGATPAEAPESDEEDEDREDPVP